MIKELLIFLSKLSIFDITATFILLLLLVFLVTWLSALLVSEIKESMKFNNYLKNIFKKHNIKDCYKKEIMSDYGIQNIIFDRIEACTNVHVNGNDLESVIWALYVQLLLDKLQFNCYYFSDYRNINKIKIEQMAKLLFEKSYKHKNFLIKNLIYLIDSVEEPYNFLDNIDNLDITYKQKEREINKIIKEISEALDIFLEITSDLYEQNENEKKLEEDLNNFSIFDDLNQYNNLLIEVKNDLKNKKVIFG